MTRLVLVRHGEAQSAVDRIVGGHKWGHAPETGWRLVRCDDAAHLIGLDR